MLSSQTEQFQQNPVVNGWTKCWLYYNAGYNAGYIIMLVMVLVMMLVMTDILISALKFYPVRITQSGFPHYVITYLVIIIGVSLMRQGIVEAGDWHVHGVYVSVNCWGWGRISVLVVAQSFFGGLVGFVGDWRNFGSNCGSAICIRKFWGEI